MTYAGESFEWRDACRIRIPGSGRKSTSYAQYGALRCRSGWAIQPPVAGSAVKREQGDHFQEPFVLCVNVRPPEEAIDR